MSDESLRLNSDCCQSCEAFLETDQAWLSDPFFTVLYSGLSSLNNTPYLVEVTTNGIVIDTVASWDEFMENYKYEKKF